MIATETGMIEQLEHRNPAKKFYPVGDNATCEYMKLNTLEKIVDSLEKLQYRVTVPEEIAVKAKRAIDRMIAIG